MTLVLDASVALKWFFRGRGDEPHAEAALDLLQGHASGRHALLAPPHFTAEVCAVLAREAPSTIADDWQDLQDLAIPVDARPEVYARAMQLSHDLGHHLFDTLYHAVALEHEEAMLVTADERYWRLARHHGRLVRLQDFKAQLGA